MAQFGALALCIAAVFVLGILLAVNSPQGNFVLKTFVDKIPFSNNKDIQQDNGRESGVLLGDSVEKENQNEESGGRPSAEVSNSPGTRTDLTPPEPSFNSPPKDFIKQSAPTTTMSITPIKSDSNE